MNALYQQLGNNMQSPFGNMQNLIQKFNQFRSTFQGDPRAKVQELLNSGRMSQTQYNQLQSFANQFKNMIQ